MAKLVFSPPGPNEPGYLRRLRESTELLKRVDRLDLQAQDELVAYLLQWVKEPEDKEDAKNLLLDLSQIEFRGILAQLFGSGESPLAENPE